MRSPPAFLDSRPAVRPETFSTAIQPAVEIRPAGPRPSRHSIDSITSSAFPTLRPSGCSIAVITARVGLPEVSLGIIPGYGGTQRLSRIAGPGVAREWVLTGEMYSAEEAHRVGVVNRLFEADQLREGTLKMVQTILSRGPVAVRLALETIRRGQNMSQQEGEIIESDMFGLASTTADMKEGMSAFLEKRPAKFVGR